MHSSSEARYDERRGAGVLLSNRHLGPEVNLRVRRFVHVVDADGEADVTKLCCGSVGSLSFEVREAPPRVHVQDNRKWTRACWVRDEAFELNRSIVVAHGLRGHARLELRGEQEAHSCVLQERHHVLPRNTAGKDFLNQKIAQLM